MKKFSSLLLVGLIAGSLAIACPDNNKSCCSDKAKKESCEKKNSKDAKSCSSKDDKSGCCAQKSDNSNSQNNKDKKIKKA